MRCVYFVFLATVAHAGEIDWFGDLPKRAAVAETTTRATGCPTCGPRCQCGPTCECDSTSWSWHCTAADEKARAAVMYDFTPKRTLIAPHGMPTYLAPSFYPPQYSPLFFPSAPQSTYSAPVYGGSYGYGPAG